MKTLLLTILLFATYLPPSLSAQEKETKPPAEPATKLEAFLSKKGSLIIKDSYDLGYIGRSGRLELDALVIYEPGTEGHKIRGIRIEAKEAGRFEKSNTSFLDLEEVADLSKAIAYMSDLTEKWKGTERGPYIEVIYSSKGDFKVGFYQKDKNINAFASSGYIGKATVFLGTEQLSSLRALLDKGLEVLKEK